MNKEYFVKKIYTANGITKEKILENGNILHLGCGNSKLRGATGVDMLSLPGVDVLHNLDKIPWPFEDNSFDLIFAHSALEHVNDIVGFFKEVWRVGKNGARIVIAVPYFRSVDSFTDPTHKHFFTTHTLDYFIDKNNSLANYSYTDNKFKKIGFWYGWPVESKNPLVRALKYFMYSHSRLYDQYISLFFPVKILVWELEIVK